MEMMRLDGSHKLLGSVNFTSLDLSQGVDANRFTVKIEQSQQLLAKGYFVDIPGTEYGGIVRSIGSETMGGLVYQVCNGHTWGGLLNCHVIRPRNGQSYYQFSGEAHAQIESLIEYLGLENVFVASESSSDIDLSYDVRFAYAFDALREALRRADARLVTRYDYGLRRCVLSAEHLEQKNPYVSDTDQLTIEHYQPVNHLVCLGTGEMQERIVIDLYADAEGNVSKTQSFFGAAEQAEMYDYSSAEADALEEEGRRQLKELQVFESIQVNVPDETQDVYALDEIVRGFDVIEGRMVSAMIAKKILMIDADGNVEFEYETDPVTRS